MNAPQQRIFQDPQFELQFSYPVSVDGHIIEIEHEHTADSITVRLASNNRHDVYFEISKFVRANAEERYALLKERSRQTNELSISEAEAIALAQRSGLAFTLQRGDLTRYVILIQASDCFYRITYNPLHAANQKMLETVHFT